MNALLVGYARVSTGSQDLTAQRDAFHALGVGDDRIYVDHGLTGTNRNRPGLALALAACRSGDIFVVTKLDRLARFLPDARDILAELTAKNVRLSMNGSLHDPSDPVGRLLINVLAMVAEFEADLIRSRTREGLQLAKAKGHLRGKQPKPTDSQARHLVELADLGTYSTAELAGLFGVTRSTIYRTLLRARASAGRPQPPVHRGAGPIDEGARSGPAGRASLAPLSAQYPDRCAEQGPATVVRNTQTDPRAEPRRATMSSARVLPAGSRQE